MMRLRLCVYVYAIILTIGFVTSARTQILPSKIPPQAVGPATLSGAGNGSVEFHEFFTQPPPDTLEGDITGIAAPDSYWVYVTGIDASGVTGPVGRKIVFNLQDAENGSLFKHLGISFTIQDPLQGQTDFLECYQAEGNDGLSTHSLGTGVLATNILDLRFGFTKADSANGWMVNPKFRLNSGIWTAFSDPPFTTTVPFDFKGAKLVVGFLDGADGVVSFDNFYVLGPINPPITETFVDDDWLGTTPGDPVQFPGQFNVQTFGVNAFATIQDGIDSLKTLGALGTVNVAAGTYVESVQVDSLVHIIGAGNGNDPLGTIVRAPSSGVSTITIAGNTATGTSPSNRFKLSNMRIMGANGASYLSGSGILVETSADTTSFMTFDNVVADSNGCGIAFAEEPDGPTSPIISGQNNITVLQSAFFNDIEINNSSFSDNDDTGIFIGPLITDFDSLIISNCDILNNAQYGFSSSGIEGLTNLHVDSTTFSGNGGGMTVMPTVASKATGAGTKIFGTPSILFGDIHLVNFNGDASFTDVSITGVNEGYGIEMRGYDGGVSLSARTLPSASFNGGGTSPSGTVTFTNFQIDGSFQEQPFEYGGGMLIADYSDIANMTFTNVDLDVMPSVGADSVANVYFCHIDGTFDLNNTVFGGNASMDIVTLDSLDIDATGSTFTGASSGFEIENRVIHEMDLNTKGLVTWRSDNLYLTRQSFVLPDTSATLARAISAASPGDTVNVSSETFWGGPAPQLIFDKNLVLKGSGKDSTTFSAEAMTGTSGDSRGWFLVNPGVNIKVQDLTIDGTGFLIFEAFRINGQATFNNVCFNQIKFSGTGYGVVARGDGPVHISNSIFTEMGRTGAYYSANVTGSVFSFNTYTGKGPGSWVDYAVEIDSGANVEVANNTIRDNDGTISNGLNKTANGAVKSIPTTHSAGIFVNDISDEGTIANIHNNDISTSYFGVQIGVNPNEDNFVTLMQNTIDSSDYGIRAFSALFLDVEDNDISENDYGIFLENVSFFDVDLNDIHDNDYGLHVFGSDGEVEQNIIHGQTTRGILISDQASSGTTVTGNDFCNNALYALENLAPDSTVKATGNWWGASNGPGGSGPGSGDSVSVKVDFSLFESASIIPGSPCEDDAACVEDGDINDDGVLTPGDALCAFNTFLAGSLPASCDVDTFTCELVAADPNCDEAVTPGDALVIFQGFLDGTPPSECFGQPETVFTKLAVSELSIIQHTTLKSNGSDENIFQVTLEVDQPTGLKSFGLDLNFPDDKIEFDGIERTDLTASWTEVEALTTEPGLLRIGGFKVNAEESKAATKEVFIIHFKAKKAVNETLDLLVSNLVNDFANATVKMVDQGTSDIAAIPEAFGLHQNYPNPFNPSTLIKFDLPAEAGDGIKTTLAIYNVKGQLVRNLLDEERKAGVHSIVWDAKNNAGIQMPSGTYFYKIRAGDFTDTKKMMLLK